MDHGNHLPAKRIHPTLTLRERTRLSAPRSKLNSEIPSLGLTGADFSLRIMTSIYDL